MLRIAGGAVALSLSLMIALYFAFPPQTQGHNHGDNLHMGHQSVLVELFTSEGCSSCPPADALLQKLLTQQPVEGAEIIALEEHVDYWNRLGWSDPYSSPNWTARQTDYAAKFGNDAYTPEMVVEGHVNFVGSNASEAAREIERAALEAHTEVAIVPEKSNQKPSDSFSISVAKLQGGKAEDTAEVWLAVTEDGLRSSVNAGENKGRVLTHVATLRSLQKIGVADSNRGTISYSGVSRIKLDPHWDATKIRITVFVQESESRQILGTASVPLQIGS